MQTTMYWLSRKVLLRVQTGVSIPALVLMTAMLAGFSPAAHAGVNWPRLPTDAEIEQARAKLGQELTADNPSASQLAERARGLPAVQQQVELAKAFMDRYRLGDELLKGTVSEMVVTKMHRPKIADQAKSSEALVAFTYTGLWERNGGATYKKVDYRLYMLEYSADPLYKATKGWHFTGNGYKFGGVVQTDSGSRAQRDARLQSHFGPGEFVRGFPGAATEPAQLSCPETSFFYDARTLGKIYANVPSLNLNREQLVTSMVEAIQKFEQEGGAASPGVRMVDAPQIAQAFDSGALPTGYESALRAEAASLSARKGGKLTPGDLFYCALKSTHGNVRDALVAAHAALYRDTSGVNQAFIASCLQPLRNPNGYSDRKEIEVHAKDAAGKPIIEKRSARDLMASDQQGVWYHLFGMAALEFTDRNGLTPFVLVKEGAEIYKPDKTKALKEKGFPVSDVCGQLSNYAVALENQVRADMRRPPDPDKQCINYAGAAIGTALAKYMKLPTQSGLLARTMGIETRRQWRNNLDYVWLMKSPVSLKIEGTGGETFTFDQDRKVFSGNCDLVIVDPIVETDGTWGLIVVPFFTVQRVQFSGTKDGGVVLAYHDLRKNGARGYSLNMTRGHNYTMTCGPSVSAPALKDTKETIVPPAFDQLKPGGPARQPATPATKGISPTEPPSAPAASASKAFDLKNPATGYRLNLDYAPRRLDFDLVVNYSRPGTVLDTVGINAAPIGSFTLAIEDDGRVVFRIYDPQRNSAVRAGNGWHLLRSESKLGPGSDHKLRITVDSKAFSLWLDGRREGRLELATPLSGAPVYVGDFPGDDGWGGSYHIHPAMTGTVSVRSR